MATLIKRPGSPYWIVAFDVTLPDGTVRRLKKSTKKKKRSEALVEALRIEEAETKVSASTGEQASKAYSILTAAAAAAARGELSEGKARELLSKLTEASTGSPLKFYTVRGWVADWLAMKSSTGKKTTLSRYRGHMNAFLGWLGEKADGRLESLTKADIRSFREAIRSGWSEDSKAASEPKRGKGELPQAAPRTAKTTNQYMSDVAGMLRSAVREGLLLASPAAALERLPEDDSIQREIFTLAEIGKLVEFAGDTAWNDRLFSKRATADEKMARSIDWQGMILAGFYIGLRLGDCGKLTIANLDPDRKYVSFIPAKTSRKKKKLTVPLHPRMRTWISERGFPDDPAAPIFPALHDTKVQGTQGLSAQFIAIMEHGGIDRRQMRQGVEGGQKAQYARSFHALRHSLTSTLANADVSEEIRRRIVGHESADVHAIYTHTERETLARALEKLPSV